MKPSNRAPFFACLYHGLCETARKHGYALAIHGSVVTDLDLVAIPWTDEAVSAEALRNALMEHIGAVDYEGLTRRQFPDNEELVGQIVENERKRQAEVGIVKREDGAEIKPHGRLAWNLYMDAGAKVDLSVMPRIVEFDCPGCGKRKPSDQFTTPEAKLLMPGLCDACHSLTTPGDDAILT